MFKIQILDTFINECQSNGKEINFQNFSVVNESYSINGESVIISEEIFEAYMKYVDVSGTEMVTINEFEKIKSFAEFIQSKEDGEDSEEEEEDEDSEEEEEDEDEELEDEDDSEESDDSTEGDKDAAAEPAAEPAADTSAEDEEEEEEEESPEDALKVEGVQTQPESVKTQEEESSDDKAHQTAIPQVSTDGQKTADAIEDVKMKMGEPQTASAGVAGEEEAEKLQDANAKVKPLSENALENEGAKVKTQEGESDDPKNGTIVPEIDSDGQKTADEIEDETMAMGEPQKASTGDAGEKKGESLVGESEKKSLITEDTDSFVINDIISEEASEIIESIFASLGFDVLNEDLGTVMKVIFTNPIKGLKIKNNLKQYAKYKLDMAAIDMDTVRKKQAALKDGGEISKDDKEKLDTAEKAKKQAVKDKISAVLDRIGQLSTTEPLKKFAALAKTKADLAAAQKLLKIAQGEEADALKLKVDKYKEDITNYNDELEDYAKKAKEEGGKSLSDEIPTGGEKDDNTEKIEKAQAKLDAAKEEYNKVKDGDDEKAKLEARLKFAQAQLALSKLKEDDDEKTQGFKDEIENIQNEIKELKNSEPANNEPANNEPANNEPESEEIEKHKAKLKEYQDALSELKNKENKTKDDTDKIDMLEKAAAAEQAKIEALRKGASEGFQLDANNPLIKEAMKEANALIGGGTGSPLDNIAKVNSTRDILRKAGLI